MNSDLDVAERLFSVLKKMDTRIVFAESCTAGLIAATLAGVPGISAHLCGSAVTYRDEEKENWLKVDPVLIKEKTAVCADVALQMAVGVLNITPSAGLAVAITGHLGPNAPVGRDGVAYVGFASRDPRILVRPVETLTFPSSNRLERQYEATRKTLWLTADWLENR